MMSLTGPAHTSSAVPSLTQNDVVIDSSGCWSATNRNENRNYITLLRNFARYFQQEFDQAFVTNNDNDWNNGRPDIIEVAAAQLVSSIEKGNGRFVIVSDINAVQKGESPFHFLDHQAALKKVTDDLVFIYEDMKLVQIRETHVSGRYVNQFVDGSIRSNGLSTSQSGYTSVTGHNSTIVTMAPSKEMSQDRSQHHPFHQQFAPPQHARILSSKLDNLPSAAVPPSAYSTALSQYHASVRPPSFTTTPHLPQLPHECGPFVDPRTNQFYSHANTTLSSIQTAIQTYPTMHLAHLLGSQHNVLQLPANSTRIESSSEMIHAPTHQTSVFAQIGSLGLIADQRQQPRKRKRPVRKLDLSARPDATLNGVTKRKPVPNDIAAFSQQESGYDPVGIHTELNINQSLVELSAQNLHSNNSSNTNPTKPEIVQESETVNAVGKKTAPIRLAKNVLDQKSRSKKAKNCDTSRSNILQKSVKKDEKLSYMRRLILAVLRKLVAGKSPIAASKVLDLPLGHPGSMGLPSKTNFVLIPLSTPPDKATVSESTVCVDSNKLMEENSDTVVDVITTENYGGVESQDSMTLMRPLIDSPVIDASKASKAEWGLSAMVSDDTLEALTQSNLKGIAPTDTVSGSATDPAGLTRSAPLDSLLDSTSASTSKRLNFSAATELCDKSESKDSKVVASLKNNQKANSSKEMRVELATSSCDTRKHLGKIYTEKDSQRLMRLLLRHRYLAAAESGMSLFEFSKNLLKLWGCHHEVNFVSDMESSMKEEHAVRKRKKSLVGRSTDIEQLSVSKKKSKPKKSHGNSVEDGLSNSLERDPVRSVVPCQNQSTLPSSKRTVDDNEEQDLNIDSNEHLRTTTESSVDEKGYWTQVEREQFLIAWEKIGLSDWSAMSEYIPTRKRSQIAGFGRYVIKKLKLLRSDRPNTDAREFLLGRAAQFDNIETQSQLSHRNHSVGPDPMLINKKGTSIESLNYRDVMVTENDGMSMDSPTCHEARMFTMSIGHDVISTEEFSHESGSSL